MLSILDLYTVLCSDISAISARVGRGLPSSPIGEFESATFDYSAQEIAALAIAKSFGKKCMDIVSDNAADVCLLNFVEADGSCGDWRLLPSNCPPRLVIDGRLRDNPSYGGAISTSNRELLELVRMCLNDTFTRPTPMFLLQAFPDFSGEDPWSWENIFLCGDIGPGAALGASGFSWYEKFYQSPLTYTNPVLLEAYGSILPVGSLRWHAEQQRAASYGYLAVQGGKYSSVPKSFKTERSIEIQPSLNMWAQKGLACIISAFLEQKYGFNLALQPFINQELARRGSISGELATIDLKDASNRIPKDLIDWLLSGHPLLNRLTACRTEKVLMPWNEWKDLHLFSSMGNGYTFVLQTAVFLAIVEAVFILRNRKMMSVRNPVPETSVLDRAELWDTSNTCRLLALISEVGVGSLLENRPLQMWGASLSEMPLPQWGVFGDDIICPVDLYSDVVRALELCNAQVNPDKSFSTGLFRESCGADWYDGRPVRGVYAKTLETPQDRIVLLNRLVEWSAVTGLALPRTCKRLWKSLENHLVKVPLRENHDAGVRVTQKFASAPLPTKETLGAAKDLQCRVVPYIAYVPAVRKRTFQGAEHQIYGVGLLLGMIRGEICSEFSADSPARGRRTKRGSNSLFLGLRQADKPRYEQRWCYTTCWDSTLHPYISAANMDAALTMNLGALLR